MSVNYKSGQKDTRPWGDWEVLDVGDNYIVKRIRVLPNKKLSLQLHNYREEHWIIAEGNAVVTLDEGSFDAPLGSHVFIRRKQKHRMSNNTDKTLVFIEIQAGDTLDENDIIRFEDAYGRV